MIILREHVWCHQGLLYPTIIQRITGNAVAECLRSSGTAQHATIDAKGISTIESHAMEELRELCLDQKTLHFWINADSIQNVLYGVFEGCSTRWIPADGTHLSVFVVENRISADLRAEQIHAFVLADLAEHAQLIRTIVDSAFCPFASGSRLLPSTPLRAIGMYDARRIISVPDHFGKICIALADLAQQPTPLREPTLQHRLLSVSLRGGVLGAGVASLLGMPLDLVDHIGPRMKHLEGTDRNDALSRVAYTLIADFVIGGSEARGALGYVSATGASLARIVCIGSALPTEVSIGMPVLSLVGAQDIRSRMQLSL